MRLNKILICISCFFLFGCQSTVSISKEDALEVAMDSACVEEEDITDSSIKKSDGAYKISFTTEDGKYSYTVSTDGSIQSNSFKSLEEKEEDTDSEDDDEEISFDVTKPENTDMTYTIQEGISSSDANKAFSTALDTLAISSSYVKDVKITDNGNYVCRITLTNGESTTYVVEVNKSTFALVKSYTE